MATQMLNMLGAMPIPIGHRVEIYTLSRDVGVFTTDVQPAPDEQLVQDLETGVFYGRTWHFQKAPYDGLLEYRAPRTDQPPAHVAVLDKVRGRILECRVLTEGQHRDQSTFTTFVVELESEPTTLR